MLMNYLKDSTKHKYPILISSACDSQGVSEIHYCIRKHQAEDFFSLTVIGIEGDYVDVWTDYEIPSLVEANQRIADILQDNKQLKQMRTLFRYCLSQDPRILHITLGFTITYLDKDGVVRVSTRSGNTFNMPGFSPTTGVLKIFQNSGGVLNV